MRITDARVVKTSHLLAIAVIGPGVGFLSTRISTSQDWFLLSVFTVIFIAALLAMLQDVWKRGA
jgi:F0F1-type ATP synthase assembly protein I